MITLIGKEVTAKMKKQVEEMVASMNGYIPTAAIVRIGERPDDLSYEKNAIKKMTAVGMKCEVFAFPEDITVEKGLFEHRATFFEEVFSVRPVIKQKKNF